MACSNMVLALLLACLVLRSDSSVFSHPHAGSQHFRYRGGADKESTASSSSTWKTVNSWFQSTGELVYQKTVKPALDVVLPVKSGPIEQYEIFGVWRICLDDGDEIVFLEIQPHKIAYESKDNTVSYTFHEASWPLSAKVEFKYKNKTYSASLRRRIPRSLKLKGDIYEQGWWWKRSVGTFVGRKMAYRELKGEEAKVWSTDDDEDDCTATTAADSASDDSSGKRPTSISVKLKVD